MTDASRPVGATHTAVNTAARRARQTTRSVLRAPTVIREAATSTALVIYDTIANRTIRSNDGLHPRDEASVAEIATQPTIAATETRTIKSPLEVLLVPFALVGAVMVLIMAIGQALATWRARHR